ncbi:MAG: hypothetical protein P8I83_05725 [Paracoccaceae bacterium]|nr:hypothetical protein [Paracoccaceae bacterium]
MVQLHVRQKPTPKGVAIPLGIRHRLRTYVVDPQNQSELKHRARAMSL